MSSLVTNARTADARTTNANPGNLAARWGNIVPRWGTASYIIEAIRKCLGGKIDIDPCSEEYFQRTVQAVQYYSLTERNEDGLVLPWTGRFACNPPGGLVREFWQRAVEQLASGIAECGVWIGFSLEQLAVLADEEVHPADFSLCYLRKRIPFDEPPDLKEVRRAKFEAQGKKFKEDSTPSHSNYIVGMRVSREAFECEFATLGKIVHGPLALPASNLGSLVTN